MNCRESQNEVQTLRKMAAAAAAAAPAYDRRNELRQFDDTKAGVKGLVDAGVAKIPRIFLHPPEDLPESSDRARDRDRAADLRVPVVDIRLVGVGVGGGGREEAVDAVRGAASGWGFFQLVNHGIPSSALGGVLAGIERFHEEDAEAKKSFYSRDRERKVRYESNFDLYRSEAANWRDTLTCIFDGTLDPHDIPEICREVIMDFRKHMLGVVETLCELLSEALGLSPEYLRGVNCAITQLMVAHYYPPCPEPDLTLGTAKHTDPSVITVLLQDGLGGLQVLHNGRWVDVSPIPGALVVNIGDLLQLMSNDKFKSAEHRVLASPKGPRISVATFFSPSYDEKTPYGPIKELISEANPPVYRDLTVIEYITNYLTKGLKISSISDFKL